MVSEPETERCANEEAEPRSGVDTRCVSKDVGPQRGGFGVVSHRLEKGTSASEDAGPQRGWIVRSHVDWRRDKAFFIRMWKPLSNKRILKILKGSLKGKT